jgi:hypothetical protein
MNQRRLTGLGVAIALVIIASVFVAYAGPVGSFGATPSDTSKLDIDDGEELALTASEDATVTGTVDAPAGTEATVRLQSSGESPYLMSDTVTLDSDGAFETAFDLSRVETEHEATLVVTADGQAIERTITVQPPN